MQCKTTFRLVQRTFILSKNVTFRRQNHTATKVIQLKFFTGIYKKTNTTVQAPQCLAIQKMMANAQTTAGFLL